MRSITCNLFLCDEDDFNDFWRRKMFFDEKAVQVVPIYNGDGSISYVPMPVVIPSQEKGKEQVNKEPNTPNKKS